MGKQWKQWQTLFWGAADGDCSREIKRCLLLGRKVMTNLDSILKSRDITLPTKVRLVKAMVFTVVMCGCEIWTEGWVSKNWCFWTVVLAIWCEELTHWKRPDAGKDWRQEEKGKTEDETVGWHHQLDGHEFEQVPGTLNEQGIMACCSPWGCKAADTTERLN